MTRSRLLFSSALALVGALVLGACAAANPAAFSVGGQEFTDQDVNDEVEAVMARPEFFATVFQFCPTSADPTDTSAPCPQAPLHDPGTYPQAVASFVIRQRIFFSQVEQELAKRGVSPTVADQDFVDEAFSQAGADGRVILDLLRTADPDADEAFIAGLLDDFASQVALQNLFPDEASFNALVSEANETVEVNSRYGTWDRDLESLEPPTGALPLVESGGLAG